MKKSNLQLSDIPSSLAIKEEIKRHKYQNRYRRILKSTIFSLVTVAAFAVLVATLWMPVLQIYGESMTPTLGKDEIVLSIKTDDFKTGDVIAFYHGNKLLVKRCIACPADWVNIDSVGNVFINNIVLDEPYLTEKSIGTCDIDLPYQVPENKYFVMGDHRETSIDSRTTTVGCISTDEIVGKIVFRIFPFDKIGFIQ